MYFDSNGYGNDEQYLRNNNNYDMDIIVICNYKKTNLRMKNIFNDDKKDYVYTKEKYTHNNYLEELEKKYLLYIWKVMD